MARSNYYIKRIINRFLKCFVVRSIPGKERIVYLTFDDGPESGITEFVLNELDKYCFKATFFCRGDNAENNPELIALIKEEGHKIGNHSYGHVHSYTTTTKQYIKDVKHAYEVLQSKLFRPPHGSLTLSAFLRLCCKYKLIYWSLNSEDSNLDGFDYHHALDKLIKKTSPGDVILFHFCHKHEKETMILLPDYLQWLSEQGYKSKVIE